MDQLTISLVRHGKTAGNLAGAYVGSIDQPVEPDGIEELEALRRTAGYPPVQALFASPMLRCVQTARILYPDHQAVTVDGLRERHFGEFEGKSYMDIVQIPGNAQWGSDERSMTFPGGEEMDDFCARCSQAFWETMHTCVQRNIHEAALVVHGGVIMALMQLYCEEKRGYFEWMCGNGCGYLVGCDTGSQTLKLRGKLGG